MDIGDDLAHRFFTQARLAVADETPVDFSTDLILQIAADEGLRFRFEQLAASVNDPELKSRIRSYLQNIVRAQRSQSQLNQRISDSIKQAVSGVGAGTAILAVASMVSGPILPVSIFLFAGGSAAVIVGTGGSSIFGYKADRNRNALADVEKLIDMVR